MGSPRGLGEKFMLSAVEAYPLVAQQKKLPNFGSSFAFIEVVLLNLESNHRSFGVVYNIFTYAAIEKVGNPLAAMGANANKIGVDGM